MSESGGSSKSPAKVFDVSHPGKSAPSATSKPVIVTNRPVLKDPMMVDESDSKDSASDTAIAPTNRLKISPITITSDATDDDSVLTDTDTISEVAAKLKKSKSKQDQARPEKDEPTTEAKAEPVEESAAKKTADEPVATDKPAEAAAEPEPVKDEANLKTGDDEIDPTDPKAGKQDTEAIDEKRATEIEQLADSHKYYLPINQVEKRRAKRYAWAGVFLIVLLAVAWGDVALDAGLVTIPGVKAPTHFFK